MKEKVVHDPDALFRAFLADLTLLTKKHGIVIGGCGCCGSPWLDMEGKAVIEAGTYKCDPGGHFNGLEWVPADELTVEV